MDQSCLLVSEDYLQLCVCGGGGGGGGKREGVCV